MAKSMRSKWKKAQRRIKAKKHAPAEAERIEKLNKKLELASKGGLSKVPHVDPIHGNVFTHKNPSSLNTKEPLSIDPLTTKVVTYGVDRPTANSRVHSQHPSRQPGRFRNVNEEPVMTEEDAAPNYGEPAGADEEVEEEGPEEVVLGFGAEEGLVTLSSATRKEKKGKKIGGAPVGTRLKKGGAKQKKAYA